jgi:two-component sensor histidine kinase
VWLRDNPLRYAAFIARNSDCPPLNKSLIKPLRLQKSGWNLTSLGAWSAKFSGASLRTRLIALSLGALIPSFAIIAFTQYQINQSRQLEVEQLAVRSALQGAFELDRIISAVKILIATVSHVPDVQDLNDGGCGSYLASLQADLPNLTALAVLDTTGRLRCGFPAQHLPNESFAERPYFRDALQTRDPVIGEYTIGKISGRPVLPIALAIRDHAGTANGVIVASLDLSWLGEVLQQRGVPPGGSLTVADRNGVIIARQPLSDRFVGTKIPSPYLRLLTAPHHGWEELVSQDGTRRILGYVPLTEPPVGLYISAGLSTEVSYQAVNLAARVGVALVLAGALATLLATWTTGSRVFVRPIEQITQSLRMWRSGDRSARTGQVAGHGEIGDLGAELDRLMDEVERSQEQQALLAGELEHRVKNTLATVQALAASTLNKPIAGNELLSDFLARIAALGRTHEVLTRETWEAANLRQLLVGVLQPLVDNLETRIGLIGPDVELPASKALAMTMVVHELCTNALKYGSLGTPDGRVELTWAISERGAGRLLEMTWREKEGPAVEAPAGNGGFGTRMIERALRGFGGAEIAFDPSGLTCRIEITLDKPVEI